jgi:hypothetical protein
MLKIQNLVKMQMFRNVTQMSAQVFLKFVCVCVYFCVFICVYVCERAYVCVCVCVCYDVRPYLKGRLLTILDSKKICFAYFVVYNIIPFTRSSLPNSAQKLH